jgi:hypothetical protein
MNRIPFGKFQRGASLITAVFLITALAAIAALMTRQTIHSTTETTNEYLSSQALYTAEAGVDRAVYDILYNAGTGVVTDQSIPGVTAWFTTTVVSWPIDSGANTYYQITSTGEAGGTAATPVVSRQLVVYFMP